MSAPDRGDRAEDGCTCGHDRLEDERTSVTHEPSCPRGDERGRAVESILHEWVEAFWEAEARVYALEAALPDPDDLELLADWFDKRDRPGESDEVQRDLREWARRARIALSSEREATP